jgi:hypothetical protein
MFRKSIRPQISSVTNTIHTNTFLEWELDNSLIMTNTNCDYYFFNEIYFTLKYVS